MPVPAVQVRSDTVELEFSSLFDYTILESIYKFYKGLPVTPISRYYFRNSFVVLDQS